MNRPLDKQEALAYGQFVAAAYTMFCNDEHNLTPLPSDDFPQGWQLSAWIQMSDFLLNLREPRFYGFVAHETANPDHRVIAIRGTEGILEWIDDAASVAMVPFRQVPAAGKVAFGFDNIYASMKVVPVPTPLAANEEMAHAVAPEPFNGSFADQLEQLALHREAERGVADLHAPGLTRRERPTVVSGHSLGSALATLFVLENSVKAKFDISLVSTLASPFVGNSEFKQVFDALPVTSWRIVNIRDFVPKVPFADLGFQHVDTAYPFDSLPFARHKLACYHSIQTYLHWLDERVPVTKACALP